MKSNIKCIVSLNVREAIKEANSIDLKKEEIISMFALGNQIFIVYER